MAFRAVRPLEGCRTICPPFNLDRSLLTITFFKGRSPCRCPFQFIKPGVHHCTRACQAWNWHLDILAEYRVAGQYGYDGAGRVQTVTYGQVGTGALNGAGVRADAFQHAFAYNGANQLTGNATGRLGAASVASFDYYTADANRGLSPSGRRNALREVVNGVTRSVNYDYDLCNRLVHEDLIVDSGGTSMVGRLIPLINLGKRSRMRWQMIRHLVCSLERIAYEKWPQGELRFLLKLNLSVDGLNLKLTTIFRSETAAGFMI
jgi:hypothetical protein